MEMGDVGEPDGDGEIRHMPLTYFEELRHSPHSTFQSSIDSNLVYVNDTYRLAHIVSLIPVTEQRQIRLVEDDRNEFNETTISSSGSISITRGNRQIRRRQLADKLWLENGIATYLAMLDFNRRRSLLVPDLEELIGGDCDVYMTMDFRDTQFTPSVAGYEMYQTEASSTSLSSSTNRKQRRMSSPTAIVGCARSAVAEVISILGGSFHPSIPLISSQATSRHLDNVQQFPYFARTIPSNGGDAKAICLYLKSIGVTHFGVLYANDSFGEGYWIDLVQEADKQNLQVFGASYDVSIRILRTVEVTMRLLGITQ